MDHNPDRNGTDNPGSDQSGWLAGLSLLTSLSTLVCCALPALLVTIGAGAVLGGIVSTIPQLIWLSLYKVEVFITAGILQILAGWMIWQARNAPCPADPEKAAACKTWRRRSRWIYGISVILYLIAAFFAFLADDLLV